MAAVGRGGPTILGAAFMWHFCHNRLEQKQDSQIQRSLSSWLEAVQAFYEGIGAQGA